MPIMKKNRHFIFKESKEMSQMIIRCLRDIHMEAKAQASYKGISLQDYVIEALLDQINKDKKNQ